MRYPATSLCSSVFDDSASIFVGTHRIQRVPPTEKKGRRHTSFVIVSRVETSNHSIVLENKDIRVETYRASGKGGQHRNKTDSAVRMTHIPTGIVATASEQRSQHQNKEMARKRLAEKLSAPSIDTHHADGVGWDWCDWRDEVVLPSGTRKSMSRTLRKGI